MKADQDNIHKDLVDLWEKQNTQGLRDEQLIQIYGMAFNAVVNRCLATLSNVTLKVVIDRILVQAIENFPFLSLVTMSEPSGLVLKGLIQKNRNYKTDELKNGLSYLLVEFLTVIGNITSDVLTESLHLELMEVTSESALNVLEVQSLRAINSANKKRGK